MNRCRIGIGGWLADRCRDAQAPRVKAIYGTSSLWHFHFPPHSSTLLLRSPTLLLRPSTPLLHHAPTPLLHTPLNASSPLPPHSFYTPSPLHPTYHHASFAFLLFSFRHYLSFTFLSGFIYTIFTLVFLKHKLFTDYALLCFTRLLSYSHTFGLLCIYFIYFPDTFLLA